MRQYWALGLALLLAATAVADDEPPVRGRPARFNGAVGSFRIHMTATPTAVRVGQPITLTVHIEAERRPARPPGPLGLEALPAFAERFHIEPLREPGPANADDTHWEYVYRLKARNADVDAVPSLPFSFYRPPAGPGRLGAYQTTYAERIPLKVSPAEEASLPTAEDTPLRTAPSVVWEVVEGTTVLRRQGVWPRGLAVLAALAIPAAPLGCVIWLLLWHRFNPDAARHAREQRTLAGRRSLQQLARLHRLAPADQPAAAAAIVAGYLHQRLSIQPVEPSPAELGAPLRTAGYSEDVVQRVMAFFESCDTARFAPPGSPMSTELATEAAHVVQLLEAKPCPQS